MPVIHNGIEAYQGHQLVVEMLDTGLIQEELRRLGFASARKDSSALLSLTLVELSQVDSAVAALRQDSALVAAAVRGRRARGQADGEIGDLDLTIFALRRRMREAYDGWTATIGKNRILGRVQGSPYIKGAVGDPQPVVKPLVILPVPRRAGARVAILDTRLYRHPDLAGRYLGESAAEFRPPHRDTQAHATFIAGLIAQRAPAAELIVRPVLDDDGANAHSWEVAKELAAVSDTGVAVLNLSLGCATLDRMPPLSLTRAIERLIPTVVVIAAAGNNGSPESLAASGLTLTTPHYPAAIDGVVAVGAYDPADGAGEPAAFSPQVPWVSLLAPGVGVPSTFLPGLVQPVKMDALGHVTDRGQPVDFGQPGYATWSGTSFAAANVTGAIAARIRPGRVGAYEALDQLRKSGSPDSPSSDILPGPQA